MWVGALNEVILRWLLTGQPNPLVNVAPALKNVLLRSIGADPEVVLGCTRVLHVEAP